MLAARQPFELRPSDTRFQKIDLETPVTVTSGDVWVGYTNTVTATDERLIYHAAIDTWRFREALRATLRKRPDLLAAAGLDARQRAWLAELEAENRVESPETGGRRPSDLP